MKNQHLDLAVKWLDRSPVRESEIEKKVTAHAIKHGWLAIKIVPINCRGLPDHLYIHEGKIIMVEFKAPGEKPRKLQVLIHDILRKHGVEVYVIDDVDKGFEVFQ